MQAMTADQAAFWLKIYVDTLKRESQVTRTVLEAVPAERSDYRPDPYAKSAMELVRHIALAENRFVEVVTTGAFDTSSALPETVKTPSDVAAWYADRSARNLSALASATAEQLSNVVDFRGVFKQPAMFFVMLGLHHTIHHRGQLSAYIRSMGGKVPAIYGESYDSAEAKRAGVV
jgi:uncharacterized damage-inducible protein DinB